MTKNKLGQLSDYYSQLQNRLQHYATLKRQLDTRGEEMKKEISRRVEEKSELLRAREKQLLRQVDVASAHFMSVYLVHHAHLHQLVGTASNFLDRHNDDQIQEEKKKDSEQDDEETKELVERIRLGLKDCDLGSEQVVGGGGAAVPISVVFSGKAGEELEEAIADFGEVSWGQFCLPTFNAGDGEKKGLGFLPYWHEDYLDSEMEVLQTKPLLGTPSLVRFPKRVQALPQQKVGFPLEDKNRWLLQNLQKGVEPSVKQQNVEAFSRLAKDDREVKKSESSCSESIEILGNTDDEFCCDEVGVCNNLCDQAQWMEDDEFMLLKTFCKNEPVCHQLKDCCGEKVGQANCLKLALEKPSTNTTTNTVNINNRSVTRNANWLLNSRRSSVEKIEGQQIAGFQPVPWKENDVHCSEWKKNVVKSWERLWKADNETWLIRRKRMEVIATGPQPQPAEKNAPTPAKKEEPIKTTFDRAERMEKASWTLPAEAIIKPVVEPNTTIFTEAKQRLFSNKTWTVSPKTDNKPTPDSFFAKLRESKAASCDWVVPRKELHQEQEKAKMAPKSGPINYKSWLVPACNSSPHSEKFMTPLVRSSPIMMEKNLFSTGLTVKSGVWLLKSE